ncbi:MAG TPA: type IV pilus modification protein PilV, partial [Candidatus Binatia bacterium]|nr:type IV pilus modification protein PilV [Candidatus Binatia bacterium]
MRPHLPAAQRGFTLLEVLLTMVILAFGMLGLASLQAKMNVAEAESYQRAQAVILLQDMVDRILLVSRNDPNLATTLGGYVTSGSSPAYVGVSDAQPTASPADTQATRASYDLWQWSNSLKGAAELSGTTKVGA